MDTNNQEQNNNNRSKGNDRGERTYLLWGYENPDNKATKIMRGSTMKWCKKDCHERPMWCDRKNYMNRSDYSTAWKKKNKNKESEATYEGSSSKLKIALAGMTSPEDFAALQEHFDQLKD